MVWHIICDILLLEVMANSSLYVISYYSRQWPTSSLMYAQVAKAQVVDIGWVSILSTAKNGDIVKMCARTLYPVSSVLNHQRRYMALTFASRGSGRCYCSTCHGNGKGHTINVSSGTPSSNPTPYTYNLSVNLWAFIWKHLSHFGHRYVMNSNFYPNYPRDRWSIMHASIRDKIGCFLWIGYDQLVFVLYSRSCCIRTRYI